jgi:hypothetical protein
LAIASRHEDVPLIEGGCSDEDSPTINACPTGSFSVSRSSSNNCLRTTANASALKDSGTSLTALIAIGLCTSAWTKKDYILILGLRNEVGAPFPLNMALLRHMLKSLDAKKVKYEIW